MTRRESRWLNVVLVVLGGLLVVLALAACRRKERALPGPKPSASPAVIASAPSEPVPSGSRLPFANEDERANQIIRAWNEALNRHDADGLAGLYGETVRFYGRTLSRKAVVAAKRAAFAKQPAFFQELIGIPEFSRTQDEALTASILKRSGEGDKWEVVSAKLVLSLGDAGAFVIIAETDEPSSRREELGRGDCLTTAVEAVNALPEVERAVAAAMATADGEKARFGGLGPYDDEKGGVFGGLGIHTDERFEEQISYHVQKGVLWVSVLGDEVTIPQDALRKVKRACSP